MEQKVSVKNKILDTASNLFYTQGFNTTGINQIIAEAGIAIGSLYKHYKSKNDLLYSYLEKQEAEFFINLDEYLRDEKDPKVKLQKLISYRIELQRNTNYAGCHFIKINAEVGRRDEHLNELVKNHKAKQKAYLQEIIGQICLEHEKPLQMTLLSNIVFSMIEGAVVSATIHANTNDLEAVQVAVQQLV
jgi:AcrR family transcriptional regulator